MVISRAGTESRGGVRPVLRPGFHAARRDDGHVQVGLDEPHRVVLPDTAEVRRLLTALTDRTVPWVPLEALPARRALERLAAAGLLVSPSAGRLVTQLPTQLAASHGDDVDDRLARRHDALVTLDGPDSLVEPVRALLHAGAVSQVSPARAAALPGARASAVALAVVLAPGQVRRARVDALLRDGVPHLLVTGGATAWEVGPLVVPGLTACVRCVDAALGEQDPRRAVVLEQLADMTPPSDPALQAAALALTAREVLAYVDGDPPVTWSATLTLALDGPRRRSWSRHPHCGCAWDALAQ